MIAATLATLLVGLWAYWTWRENEYRRQYQRAARRAGLRYVAYSEITKDRRATGRPIQPKERRHG